MNEDCVSDRDVTAATRRMKRTPLRETPASLSGREPTAASRGGCRAKLLSLPGPGPRAGTWLRRLYRVFRWRTRQGRLSVHEQEVLEGFREMSLNEVRRRADEFEAAQREYEEWLKTRRANRKHPIDAHEMSGYAPEVQYGEPARGWRKLEAQMRDRRVDGR